MNSAVIYLLFIGVLMKKILICYNPTCTTVYWTNFIKNRTCSQM